MGEVGVSATIEMEVLKKWRMTGQNGFIFETKDDRQFHSERRVYGKGKEIIDDSEVSLGSPVIWHKVAKSWMMK
jgi:hypothetical protein